MNELNEIIFNAVRPVIEIRALLEHDFSHFPFGANKKITKFYRVSQKNVLIEQNHNQY